MDYKLQQFRRSLLEPKKIGGDGVLKKFGGEGATPHHQIFLGSNQLLLNCCNL